MTCKGRLCKSLYIYMVKIVIKLCETLRITKYHYPPQPTSTVTHSINTNPMVHSIFFLRLHIQWFDATPIHSTKTLIPTGCSFHDYTTKTQLIQSHTWQIAFDLILDVVVGFNTKLLQILVELTLKNRIVRRRCPRIYIYTWLRLYFSHIRTTLRIVTQHINFFF